MATAAQSKMTVRSRYYWRGNVNKEEKCKNDIHDIAIVPTVEDIVNPIKCRLRPNVIKGRYKDVQDYVDVQFRLLREDYMVPLRQSVNQFRTRKKAADSKDVQFYCDVTFDKNSYLQSPSVAQRPSSWRSYAVQFRPIPGVDWYHCKRLMNGSLVILWTEGASSSKDMLICTVFQNDPDQVRKLYPLPMD